MKERQFLNKIPLRVGEPVHMEIGLPPGLSKPVWNSTGVVTRLSRASSTDVTIQAWQVGRAFCWACWGWDVCARGRSSPAWPLQEPRLLGEVLTSAGSPGVRPGVGLRLEAVLSFVP